MDFFKAVTNSVAFFLIWLIAAISP